MLRLALACCLAAFAALPALARCQGSNLIAALPAETRAALRAAADAAPFAQGNFWRATRGGQVLHLIGTFHLDDPRHAAIVARLAPVIDSASTILVEAGPAEEAALQDALAADPSLIYLTGGPSLAETLPPATWDRLKAALRARSIPPFLGSTMRPVYLSVLLSTPPCASKDPAASQNGLDRRIIDQSLSSQVPVQALEPFMTVFGVFAQMTDQQQLDMLTLSLALAGQSEDMLTTLQDAYFAEDSRIFWEFSRWQALNAPGANPDTAARDFAMMEEQLVSARNRAWIPVIEAALAGGPVFAAFGALHLSGQDGVLALLEQAGFTLERLAL
ncbi:MAG: TraB/GumN family protein [Rhodobacter sp.]|nr:TraB/GumN family protein [Rhodobacter sp.]